MVAPEILRLKGDVELTLLHDAAEWFAKSYSGCMTVELDTTGPIAIKGILSPTDAFALASLIAIVMGAILKTRIWLQKKTWTETHLSEEIEKALVREGVKEYEITGIKNLSCLRAEGSCPCIISAKCTSTSKEYQIHIFLDGKIFTFEIVSSPVSLLRSGGCGGDGDLTRDATLDFRNMSSNQELEELFKKVNEMTFAIQYEQAANLIAQFLENADKTLTQNERFHLRGKRCFCLYHNGDYELARDTVCQPPCETSEWRGFAQKSLR